MVPWGENGSVNAGKLLQTANTFAITQDYVQELNCNFWELIARTTYFGARNFSYSSPGIEHISVGKGNSNCNLLKDKMLHLVFKGILTQIHRKHKQQYLMDIITQKQTQTALLPHLQLLNNRNMEQQTE